MNEFAKPSEIVQHLSELPKAGHFAQETGAIIVERALFVVCGV